MRCAYITDGRVSNVVEAEELPEGYVQIPEDSPAWIGWGYANDKFSYPLPPLRPVPEFVTIRQATLALLYAGLLDDVEAAFVAAIEAAEPNSQALIDARAAQVEWKTSSFVYRYKSLVVVMSGTLGLGDAQLDNLFRFASTITEGAV